MLGWLVQLVVFGLAAYGTYHCGRALLTLDAEYAELADVAEAEAEAATVTAPEPEPVVVDLDAEPEPHAPAAAKLFPVPA